jgi:hypothetical protein
MKAIVTCLTFVQLLIFISYNSASRVKLTKIKKQEVTGESKTESENPVQSQKVTVPHSTTGTETELHDAFCFINANGTVWDFNGLANDEADYRVKTPSGYLNFNLCQNALNPCAGKSGIASYSTTLEGDNCVQLAGNNTISSQFFKIYDETNNKTVIRMKLPEGDICQSDISKNYQTTIDFECNEDADTPIITNNPININSCNNKIYISSSSACPKLNMYSLWRSVQENKWAFGAVILGLGIFFCFFGENFLKITQVIAGGAITVIFVMYMVFNHTNIEIGTWQMWVILGVCLLLGCAAGFFMSFLTWLPGVIFGILLGFVSGFVVYNIGLRFIESNPTVVFWVSMSVCLIIGGVLGYFLEEEISIISTAAVGAYAMIRGISIWAGGFPDERQVYELGQKGEWDQMHELLSPAIWGYLAGFVVLSIAGMFIQFKFFYDGKKKKKGEKDEKEKDEDEKTLKDEEN